MGKELFTLASYEGCLNLYCLFFRQIRRVLAKHQGEREVKLLVSATYLQGPEL